MADFNFSTSTTFMPAVGQSVNALNSSIFAKPTTLTPFMNPYFYSVDRTDNPSSPKDHGNLFNFTIPTPSVVRDKPFTSVRPRYGQIFPRGSR